MQKIKMKHYSMRSLLPALLSVFALQGCAHHHAVKEAAVPDTRMETLNNDIASKNKARFYSEISFQKGSSNLGDRDQIILRVLMDQTINSGKVEQIKVISWADEAYPEGDKKTLSKVQQNIAEARNDTIKRYIANHYPSLTVNVYNMAKRPGSFEKMFHTADAKTKQAFLDAGATDDGRVRLQPKTSKSLILSVLEK